MHPVLFEIVRGLRGRTGREHGARGAAVHPTPLHEALAAFAIAALLWSLRTRTAPVAVFASYLILSGAARFLVDVRTNGDVLLGATQPQLVSLLLIAIGAGLLLVHSSRETLPGHDDASSEPTADRDRHLQPAIAS